MKNFLIILNCLVFSLKSQVSISTNLLHAIPLNKALSFEVRINKGTIANFSRFQLDVPEGIVVDEVDSKSGTFTFEENKVKIIWVVTPSEPEFAVRLRLKPSSEDISGSLYMKYYYVVNDDKKEYETMPFDIRIKDTTLPVLLSAPMVTLRSKNMNTGVARVTADSIDTSDPEKLKQQVKQLKKDSKDALGIGKQEKNKALLTLSVIAEEEKKLKDIADPAQKKIAEEKLAADKKATLENLAVAARVLQLASTLDKNANEIDRINREVNPGSYNQKEKPAQGQVSKASKASVSGELNALVPEVIPGTSANKENDATVYKIQIASLKEKPAVSAYKKLGKVSIVTENDVYKVLLGSFITKEDAYKMKAELSASVADCFVVTYKNGVRVK